MELVDEKTVREAVEDLVTKSRAVISADFRLEREGDGNRLCHHEGQRLALFQSIDDLSECLEKHRRVFEGAAVMALRPKVDREQVLEWFKGAIGGEEFGMWFPNVEADLEAAGIEVVDE